MKVKELTSKIVDLAGRYNLKVINEFPTRDKTRIDIAVLNGQDKLLAIEFERTYKWIRRRILYNGIKAHRAGFKNIFFIYPFEKNSIQNSWVIDFLKDLGMNVKLIHPDNCVKQISDLIEEKNIIVHIPTL